MPIITSNVIHRTFLIKCNGSIGTAFVLDHESRQYLVTANHVVSGIESGNAIDVFHDGRWKSLRVNVVGIGKDEVDVAVLSCSVRLSPWYPLPASEEANHTLRLGQSVAFVGYPFGWDGGGEEINRQAPVPLVKAGVVSAMQFQGNMSLIVLDAQGNPGFSGGPALFVPFGKREVELHVAGVVANYPIPKRLPVVDSNGHVATDSEGRPTGYVEENPGFVVLVAIECVLDLINANPRGFQLRAPDSEEDQ